MDLGPSATSETAKAAAHLEIEHLFLGPRSAPIVSDLDWSVGAGEIHALLGRNGAGKTTLLRAILGEVEFRGRIRRAAGRIGYVPQTQRFEPVLALNVGEFLGLTRQRRPLFLGRSRAACEEASAALASVELAGFERRLVSELSGGEVRRLLLAHALFPRPALLLLDEPTEGLDAASLPRFERAIEAARAAGSAIVLVSHDLPLIRRIATQATWIDGRVRMRGRPAEVAAAFLRHELEGRELADAEGRA